MATFKCNNCDHNVGPEVNSENVKFLELYLFSSSSFANVVFNMKKIKVNHIKPISASAKKKTFKVLQDGRLLFMRLLFRFNRITINDMGVLINDLFTIKFLQYERKTGRTKSLFNYPRDGCCPLLINHFN